MKDRNKLLFIKCFVKHYAPNYMPDSKRERSVWKN